MGRENVKHIQTNKNCFFLFCFFGGVGIFPLKALKKNTVARFHRE